MPIVDSTPCPERCPICRQRCLSASGHTRRETCGRKVLPELHACTQHAWGSLADLREMLRANEQEARREAKESIKKCSRCVAEIERLG